MYSILQKAISENEFIFGDPDQLIFLFLDLQRLFGLYKFSALHFLVYNLCNIVQ